MVARKIEVGLRTCGADSSFAAEARASAGNLPIPELAHGLAIGERQLERLYQGQVGMTPKQYAQLLRVEKARLTLKDASISSTTRLATELGYYDQAHFIREFSSVIGQTPYAYLKRHRQSPSGS
jgi:transcriptional regulator GlxA family with amidase domain